MAAQNVTLSSLNSQLPTRAPKVSHVVLVDVPSFWTFINQLRRVDASADYISAVEVTTIACNLELFTLLSEAISKWGKAKLMQELLTRIGLIDTWQATATEALKLSKRAQQLAHRALSSDRYSPKLVEPLLVSYLDARDTVMYLCGLVDEKICNEFTRRTEKLSPRQT
jgi:hypothetical protein